MTRWLGLALVAAGCTLLAGAAPGPAGPVALSVAASWPAIALQDLQGRPQRLDGPSPQWHVVNLWARWCAPCRRELPALQRLAQALQGSGVQVLTVALDDDDFGLREYLAGRGLGLPVWRPAGADLSALLALHSLPQTLVLDREGRIVLRLVGERDWDAPAERDRLRALATADGGWRPAAPPPVARRGG